jgi:hypothetical protein
MGETEVLMMLLLPQSLPRDMGDEDVVAAAAGGGVIVATLELKKSGTYL